MRLDKDFEHYQERLGRSITVRTWDRIIADLDLMNCSIPERRDRLNLLAEIRKENEKLRVTADGLERWFAIFRLLHLPEAPLGIELYQCVAKIRPLSEIQFRAWVSASGIKYGRQRSYTQGELKQILAQVVLRLASKPELMNSPQINFMQKKLTGGNERWIA